MHLKYLNTILDAQGHINRVAGISWSSNQQKLAIATADRSILLFDGETGEQRDKFSTKPSNPNNGKTSYVIRAIAFSPDSTRLAVAQSDNIIYVYKFGESWNDKKVICNKFQQPSSVITLIWLSIGPIIAGLEDGKVCALNCKTNKSQNLYAAETLIVSLSQNTRGNAFISGHHDGSVLRFYVTEGEGQQSGKAIQHSVAPYALAWTYNGIVAGGCDKRIIFYDNQGRQIKNFDYSRDDNEREFTVASCNSNGQTIAIGSFDRVRIFVWTARQNAWNEVLAKEIHNLYTVTAVTWKRDGSRLAVGSVCGSVIIFESVLRRTIFQDKFELTYIGPSQILLKSLTDTSNKIVIESNFNLEIEDVRIMGKDNYLVARTENSLILCDLTRNLISEVPWNTSGRNEKFYFENPNVCLVFNAGELSLVEYGENYILGSVRTEFVNPHVISVRLNERGNNINDNKKLAYLLDKKTISVVDLITKSGMVQIAHDSKIDWLELNETAQKLLFRDKKLRLHLIDVATSKKQLLLAKASFVQWVIQSDVAIAQNDSNLSVWYNIDSTANVTTIVVRGEVIEVVRENGETIVKTIEGTSEHVYQLDEGLVEFGTAINDCDFGRAILFLESLRDIPAAIAMWHNLANIGIQKNNLRVAQRCYAALGNASKAFYIDGIIKIGDEFEQSTQTSSLQCSEVRARVSLLDGDLRQAERIYLEQGDIESALNMYKNLRLWDDAIKLAERRGYHDIKELRDQQMSYFLSTNQEEKAGHVLEEIGLTNQAMTLYLKAQKPARSGRLALKFPHLLQNEELMESVTNALMKKGLFDLAGDLYYKLQQPDTAIVLYRKSGSYARAIELARDVSPEYVTNLEEEWGDWLVTKRQFDTSISHYIEAGNTIKALDASVMAKQWRKAVQIAKVLDEPEEIKKYAKELCDYLSSVGDTSTGEDLFIRAEMYKEAVDLLNKHSQWEKAYEIAEKYLGTDIVRDMFVEIAGKLEEEEKYRDAEKVLLTVNEPDLAIAMYKRIENYDAMIRLVERYHKEHIEITHIHLAKQLEAKGKIKNAEAHYIAAGEWKSAVQMYCNLGRWEEAHRIAKQKGTDGASNQVAFMWARSLPIEGASRILTKMGLVNAVVELACDSGQYNFALELCRVTELPADDVHLKMALELEDEGKFTEAESEFLKANKPKEAIMMHTHGGDWLSALRIAEQYIPEAINDILLNQANAALESHNFQEYEALLIRAEKPEIIINYYKENEMWSDAIRVANEYMPMLVMEIQQLQTKTNKNYKQTTSNDSSGFLQQASEYARNEEFRKAADCLLKINATNANTESVEWALIRAAEINNQFLVGVDAIEIAKVLGPRLVEINQIGPAAQLYLAAELPKEAVDVFIQTENWSKARRLAKEIDAQLVSYVESQQKIRLRNDGNVEQLADIDILGALDLLAEQGQWTRCLDKAKQHSSVVLHKYLALYATQLIHDTDCTGALSLYLSNGAPALPQNFNIYIRIAMECFGLREPDGCNVWKDLTIFLYQITESLKTDIYNDDMSLTIDRFERLLLIAHYYTVRSTCREISALQGIAVRISIGMLRYTDIIPVDKGFYEAGMDLRNVGRESEAFVILNHYLDVCEAIEEGSASLVDHSDLSTTDFPSSVPIPAALHLKNELHLHEEVREWVLAVSMDQRVDQVLPVDERNLYESSLGISDQPCIISGYPVTSKQPITFQRSQAKANRDAWSKLTVAAKMAPHTPIPEIIQFIEKWCGSANFLSQ